jgi:hypothetical protein
MRNNISMLFISSYLPISKILHVKSQLIPLDTCIELVCVVKLNLINTHRQTVSTNSIINTLAHKEQHIYAFYFKLFTYFKNIICKISTHTPRYLH